MVKSKSIRRCASHGCIHKEPIKWIEGLCHKPSKFQNVVKMAAILVKDKIQTSLIGMNGNRGIILILLMQENIVCLLKHMMQNDFPMEMSSGEFKGQVNMVFIKFSTCRGCDKAQADRVLSPDVITPPHPHSL